MLLPVKLHIGAKIAIHRCRCKNRSIFVIGGRLGDLMMKKKPARNIPRVLHVVEYLEQGGIERMLEQLARYTSKEKANLSFFSYETEQLQGIGTAISHMGFDVETCKKSHGYDFQILLKLMKKVKEQKIDVVHTHDFGPMEYVVPLKLRFPKLKLIHTQHTLHHFLINSKYVFFFQCASWFYDYIICVSKHVQSELESHGPFMKRNLVTIHNGVAKTAFSGNRASEFELKKLHLVSVSRVSQEKNLIHTLENLKELKDRKISFEFHHAGSGEESEMAVIKAAVRRFGLESHVKMHGFQNDVKPILEKGDIFISSSKTEGHPVAVLEAMANGKICVLSDIKPHRFIDEKNAIFFPLKGFALAEKLIQIAQKPETVSQLGTNAQKLVSEKYSIEKTIEQYGALYG